MATKTTITIPAAYATSLPTDKAILALKGMPPATLAAHSRLYRAAWNAASVVPTIPNKFYRWGPPRVVAIKKPLPYWWLYVADDVYTCIAEAQFCRHDQTETGYFHIVPGAEANGIIATIDFPTQLRLVDLGDVAFEMGIYDLLRKPAHDWCKWFAYKMVEAGFFSGTAPPFDGILYPSRKNPTANAISLSSEYVNRVRKDIHHTTVLFNTTPEYKQLCSSKLMKPPPVKTYP